MRPSDVARLLGAIAARDRRTIGETDVAAWTIDVGDLDYDDAVQAVAEWYRDRTDWIMAAHVREGVRRIRAARLEGHTVEITGEIADDGAAYVKALQDARARVAAGQLPPERLALPVMSEEQAKANKDRLDKMLAPAFARSPRVTK